MTKKFEGTFRSALRKSMIHYRDTKNLLRLMKDMVDIGDSARYQWHYYYIRNNLIDIFKEIFPLLYILEEL